MVIGANLNGHAPEFKLWALFQKALGNHRQQSRHHSRGAILGKNGVPASNTAADSPGRKGVIILDLSATPVGVYVCTAFTSATNFTLDKIN